MCPCRQVVGVVVLGVGIWIVADKASFLNLIKAVDHEEVKVSANKGSVLL